MAKTSRAAPALHNVAHAVAQAAHDAAWRVLIGDPLDASDRGRSVRARRDDGRARHLCVELARLIRRQVGSQHDRVRLRCAVRQLRRDLAITLDGPEGWLTHNCQPGAARRGRAAHKQTDAFIPFVYVLREVDPTHKKETACRQVAEWVTDQWLLIVERGLTPRTRWGLASSGPVMTITKRDLWGGRNVRATTSRETCIRLLTERLRRQATGWRTGRKSATLT